MSINLPSRTEAIIEATQTAFLNGRLSVSDKIQLLIVIATFLAVLVALFGERFWKWMDRPKIRISFNKKSEKCFRWADVEQDTIQDEGIHKDVKRQYFRLRVENNGSVAKNLKVRVDILRVDDKEPERFEPTTLLWISGGETIDLAREESEYVNFLSQVLSSPTKITNRVRIEVFNTKPRGIAWDRVLATYDFQLTVYGDNITPETRLIKFTPNKNISKAGTLQETG